MYKGAAVRGRDVTCLGELDDHTASIKSFCQNLDLWLQLIARFVLDQKSYN